MASSIKSKLKKQAIEELEKNFEFDELETINTLLDGKAKSNSIKKKDLETFRKVICLLSKELEWNEDETIREEEIKPEVKNCSEDVTEEQKKKETCKFLQNGNCHFGRSGKRPDQNGKVCAFSHPKVCRKHEMFGKCMNHKCEKLHLRLCREFMNLQTCRYGNNCRFFHPRSLKNLNDGLTPLHYAVENGQVKSNHPTSAQVGKTNVQHKVNSIAQNSFLGPEIQQNPFLEFMESQREILRRLEQLESQTQNPYRKW